MRPKSARFWNVRAIPRRITSCARRVNSSWPAKRMLPAVGWYSRLTQLNKLVLPAPFGPIKPTIWPSTMSNETLSSAATPPKRRLTSRTDNNASSDT